MKQHIIWGLFITSCISFCTFSMQKGPASLQSIKKNEFSPRSIKRTLISGCKDCLETTIRLTESLQDHDIPASGLGGGSTIGAIIFCNAFCKALKNSDNDHKE